jgi:hypothetical protein
MSTISFDLFNWFRAWPSSIRHERVMRTSSTPLTLRSGAQPGAEFRARMQSSSGYAQSRSTSVARGAEDTLSTDNELERGAPFCANPACALHVRLADSEVEGGGNWVWLADGRIFGRSRFGAELLCDACGTQRGPVRITIDQNIPKRRRIRQ